MTSIASPRWLAFVLLAVLLLGAPCAPAADAPKDAQTVLNGIRLKKWTKELTLTAEQQKKVQTIFDEESVQMAKITGNADLTVQTRTERINELRQTTYAKVKPLLDATQLATFEKMTTKPEPKKKA